MPPLLKNTNKNTRNVMKRKTQIEYPLNPSSSIIIWNAISTTAGLQRWFADQVTKDGKTYTFRWGKTETRQAIVVNSRPEFFIRFHWLDDEESKSYFEMKIHYNELTTDHSLEITDFVEPGEEEMTHAASGTRKLKL